MALTGDLASVDLAQVFQMLALNQKVGMLTIRASSVWKALYFGPRGVTLYFNEHLMLDKVLSTSVRCGRMQSEVVQDARDHAAAQGVSMMEVLLAGGYHTEAELEDLFRREIEEEIYDIFFWRDARFEFYEGATEFKGCEGVIGERFFFSTDSLIMEAARRIDEWSFIQERVPGGDLVYRPVSASGNVMDLSDTALSVLELVDGKRNVERLVEVTGLPGFHVHKSIAQLLDEGHIRELSLGELIAGAKECVAEGRGQDAINLYERALELDQDVPDTHVLVAQVYESNQEYELAAYHLRCVAEHYAGHKSKAQAVDILRKVIGMIPTDLAARERFVELTVGSPEFKSRRTAALAEGKTLVDLYLEIGEVERVRGVLERLLRENPDDIELKKSLVNVHSKAGDTKRVVELYESIAEDLVRQGSPIEAIKFLQKIVMIDRSRRDISDRIRSLYEMDERRRSRRRSVVALASLLCVAAALGAVWYLYEQHARERFDQIDVEATLAQKDFASASAKYKTFMETYPLTLVGRDAEAALARVESLRLSHEALLKRELLREEAKNNTKRVEYRATWQEYEELFRNRKIAEALQALEECRRLVNETGTEEDLRWAASVQLNKNLDDLSQYIGDAAALDRAAREFMNRGEWRQARERLLELTDKYSLTIAAKGAQVPVLLRSTPSAATIFAHGRPVTREVDGQRTPLRTPAWVLCDPYHSTQFELRHQGFQVLRASVDARAAESKRYVLRIVPDEIFTFHDPVESQVVARGSYLVAPLRGGKVGIARVATGELVTTISLGGLREARGLPVVTGDRFFVRTNESEIACYSLPSGKERFVVSLVSAPLTELKSKNGRIVFADEAGMVVCLDMSTGKTQWRRDFGGVSGPPQIVHRHVYVGTTAGEFYQLDLTTGRVEREKTGIPGFSSGAIVAGGVLVYATTDARVVGVDLATSKLIWSHGVGRSLANRRIRQIDDTVVVVDADNKMWKYAIADGVEIASLQLRGELLSGPVVSHDSVCVTVRDFGDGTTPPRDHLLAIGSDDLQVVWEYANEGTFGGDVASTGISVYLPDGGERVLRLR